MSLSVRLVVPVFHGCFVVFHGKLWRDDAKVSMAVFVLFCGELMPLFPWLFCVISGGANADRVPHAGPTG